MFFQTIDRQTLFLALNIIRDLPSLVSLIIKTENIASTVTQILCNSNPRLMMNSEAISGVENVLACRYIQLNNNFCINSY